MDIAIEARALSAQSGGVKTYTYELISALTKLYSQDAFEIIYGSRKPLGTFPSVNESVVPLKSEVLLPYWISGPLSRHLRARHPSVIHYTKAATPFRKIAPTVVTIYDIIPVLLPETQSPLRRVYWPSALRHAAIHADHIMTISEGSKRDIMEHFGVSDDNITVTPLAVDLHHFKPVQEKKGNPYILFVGTRDERKNVGSLIRAFATIADTIPHTLVIVGRPAKKDDGSKKVVSSLRLEERVEFRENVSYQELPNLYANADVFVWPSLYEGWGFPPQEAMASGTPVIVSDGTPLKEVVGDAGVVVPLGDSFIERLSSEIASLIHDDVRKKDLIAKGLQRVQQFSWDSVARKTYEVYKIIAV